MSEPFLGEIRMFALNYAPRGWLPCNGQVLAINQYQALFSILGTTYGGNGMTTFALPNLQGRAPVHTGSGITLGQSAGEETHTLTIQEMPSHTHQASGNSAGASSSQAQGNVWGKPAANTYAASANTTMSAAALGLAGGSQPHENMQPYNVVNFCIAINGIFPSRN